MSKSDVDLSEADRNLRSTVSELEQIAENYGDQQAYEHLDSLEDELDRIENELEASHRYNNDLRRSTYNRLNELADDLETVADRLNRHEGIDIYYENLVGGDIIIEDSSGESRRGFMTALLAGGAAAVGGYLGVQAVSDGQEDPRRVETALPEREFEYAMESSDGSVIRDLGERYERSTFDELNEVGQDISDIIDVNNMYRDVFLGFDNDRGLVQLVEPDVELLDSWYLSENSYEEARDMAETIGQEYNHVENPGEIEYREVL